MHASSLTFRRLWAGKADDWAVPVRLLCCLAVIGIELAVLTSVLPDTISAWWRADSPADFAWFYRHAAAIDQPWLYSPAVSLLVHPLTYLRLTVAYRIYFAINALAVLGVAYLGQRQAQSLEEKVAVALGVLSVPQMHWALRMGHFTPVLALALLAGLLGLRTRPLMAGLCLAVLVLKPQYAVVPGMYLIWTRNWRALASMTAGALLLDGVGFLAIGVRELGPYVSQFLFMTGNSHGNMFSAQQSWQYTWHGFLISAGIRANSLVIFDLIALSAGTVWLAWVRGSRSVGVVAVAFGGLLITPYAYFYDWGLLAVGAVLLLQAEVRGRQTLPFVAFGLYIALIAAQHATIYPPGPELFGAAFDSIRTSASATNGIYWVIPLTLAVIAYLAMAARQTDFAPVERETRAPERQRRVWTGAAMLLVPVAYLAAAFFGHVAPFEQTHDPYAPSEVVKRVPSDFPLPADSHLISAGHGDQLAYHLEWSSNEPVSEVAGIYRHLVDGGNWELMFDERANPSYKVRVARFTPEGEMTHWAMLDVSRQQDGSRISLDLFATQMLGVKQ